LSASSPLQRRSERQQLKAALAGSTKRRIELTVYSLLVPLCFLAGRLVQLQAFNLPGKKYQELAQKLTKREVLPAHRGQILAADGTALAVTLDEYDICANPRAVQDAAKVASVLARTVGGSEAEYLQALQKTTQADGSKNFFVRLARHVDGERVAKLRLLMGPSSNKETRDQRAARKKFWQPITLRPSPRRRYPLGDVACQLIGFTTGKGVGADGLEAAWDRELAGKDGEVVSRVDAQGRPVPGMVEEWRDPLPGHTIVTTIDPEIQASSDEVLNNLVKKYKPNFATAIVMRPSTGEIVAMSTAPTYDLNHRPADVVNLATNRCIQYAYEPGSTFKIITAAAAVENVPDWQSRSFYCAGVADVGGRPMHCWVNSTPKRQHGQETLSDSIRDSCNFGVYGFARLVGAPTMLDYARRFKLGERTHISGLSDVPGALPRNAPQDWGQRQLASFSFGQGVTMTPLQLIRVAATVANGGVMMKPTLVKEIRDERGAVIREFKPEVDGRIIKAETATQVTAMMERVVNEGTAKKFVFVSGYKVAGKTGSAQKVVAGTKGYSANKFISSFIGFLPSRKPEFVILVMADEPHGSHWGSEVCGPAFASIASSAMLQLRLRKGAFAPAPIPALLKRPKIDHAEKALD
jgi:cell division protein FtsI/penicillin-binding protein 2